ncbi:uncharacterized protein LOC131933021 [Physella acuta]|uniref:uncharacterized protein LOC131933021 n=1 Tax=Physella acuta TaxID=109671 RepID=UPI0027DB27E2|nr:uncharacterized protein LOC131933021 [Physella acuta]
MGNHFITLIPILMVTFVCVRAVCDPDIPSRPMPDRPVSSALRSEGTVVSCPAGHHIDEVTHKCKACPGGTFMTAMMSSENKYESCENCLTPDASTETVASPCTSVRDTHIMCKDGYYRQEAGDRCEWKCQFCQVCGTGDNLDLNYEARSCGGYNNTVCCRHNNMMVVNNTCVEKPELSTSTTTTTTTAVTHNVTGIPNKENSGNTRDSSAFMLVTLCLMTISIRMML